MFGESSHMKGKDKGDMDRDGKDEPDSEEYMDNKDAAIKKAMGKKVAEEFEQIDEEAKATVDALKKVHGDHNFHVDKKGEIKHAYLNHSHVKKLVTALNTPGKGKGMIDKMMEEVEQIDEIGDTPRGKAALTNLASQRFGRARWAAGVHRATSRSDGGATPHSRLQDKDNTVAHKAAAKAGIKPHEVPDHNYDYDKKGGYGTKVADPAHKLAARNTPKKADVQEVAMPKNAADWQAMINHQIQIAGHPVATDAQFRATTVGKDMSKIASLEPGEDMLQYATAQGGTVKK
jgi:hypothetical protein